MIERDFSFKLFFGQSIHCCLENREQLNTCLIQGRYRFSESNIPLLSLSGYLRTVSPTGESVWAPNLTPIMEQVVAKFNRHRHLTFNQVKKGLGQQETHDRDAAVLKLHVS